MGVPHLKLVAAPATGVTEPDGPARDEARVGDEALVGDAQLVARVVGGERGAFEQLYRRHAQFAFNLAVRLQGSASDVEDVVHDSFLKAHAQLGRLREPGAFHAWLGAIVISQVRTRLRRARLLRGIGLSVADRGEIESVASPSADPGVRAELAQVYALLRRLSADDRIAWTLRNVERNRLEDVATLTDCSLATAKRRILRAQRFLDAHFVFPHPVVANAANDLTAPASYRRDSYPEEGDR
ncbi:MAG: hypothetical protein RJA70_3687 [Pseudomonadota bacterium]